MTDKIVEEVHAVRRTISEECDFDLEKLGEYYVRLQDEDPRQSSRRGSGDGAEPTSEQDTQ